LEADAHHDDAAFSADLGWQGFGYAVHGALLNRMVWPAITEEKICSGSLDSGALFEILKRGSRVRLLSQPNQSD
jgi:hypothetical protein